MSKNEIAVTDCQIWPTHNREGRIKAMAQVTLNGALRLSGLRVVEGRNGLFVSYPGEKKPGTDQYFNFVFPTRREVGDAIQEQILDRYHAALAAQAA
jgi:stage V sporulation protein G